MAHLRIDDGVVLLSITTGQPLRHAIQIPEVIALIEHHRPGNRHGVLVVLDELSSHLARALDDILTNRKPRILLDVDILGLLIPLNDAVEAPIHREHDDRPRRFQPEAGLTTARLTCAQGDNALLDGLSRFVVARELTTQFRLHRHVHTSLSNDWPVPNRTSIVSFGYSHLGLSAMNGIRPLRNH